MIRGQEGVQTPVYALHTTPASSSAERGPEGEGPVRHLTQPSRCIFLPTRGRGGNGKGSARPWRAPMRCCGFFHGRGWTCLLSCTAAGLISADSPMQATYDVHAYSRNEILHCKSSKPVVGLLPSSGSTEQTEKGVVGEGRPDGGWGSYATKEHMLRIRCDHPALHTHSTGDDQESAFLGVGDREAPGQCRPGGFWRWWSWETPPILHPTAAFRRSPMLKQGQRNQTAPRQAPSRSISSPVDTLATQQLIMHGVPYSGWFRM